MFTRGYPQSNPVTYAGMFWLLAAQLVVILPLAFYLPIWLLPVLVFSAVWRYRVMKGYMQKPSIISKLLVVVMGVAGLAFSGLQHVSLDMMASLLILGFVFKSLEVFTRRDAMVVILTGYLLVAVQFLYSQEIFSAFYGIASMALLTAAMIAIQSNSTRIIENLKLAGWMLLLCLPLMLALFVLTPRISPLWTLNLASGHAKTGMTDRMTPGDIANLSQSDDLAFRVTFTGERPAQNELYWRGLVLQHFDGKTWTQFADDLSSEQIKLNLRTSEQDIKRSLVKQGFGRQYEVIYERSAQSWLFALAAVVEMQGEAIFGSDYRIMAREDVIEPLLVKITSFPNALKQVNLHDTDRRMALQLPADQNPQTRVMADRLYKEAYSAEDYIQKVLNLYQQQNFYYTLRPEVLPERHSIDEFLFASKRGFCAHYAGSFVYMMRAVGIPARVVAGYQGGEWNEKGNYLAVHQYDAHAWTEVWLANKGWVRFDPTTMVAPQRVEKNLETAVQEEGSFLENQLLSPAKHKWLDGLRQQLDASQYAWRRFVLGYDKGAQSQMMQRLFGEFSITKVALTVGGIFAGLMLCWSLFLGLAKRHRQEAIEHRLYRKFCGVLAKKGIVRELSQTPADYAQLAAAHNPHMSESINDFTRLYTELCYTPATDSFRQTSIAKLKQLLKRIK
ncbi:MAG: FIG001454: Transglutaminase-like enzymes, putative cysteine proteases [uncultured Thiotrichaceae bacterium]|uniref:FIG001454: Transglutaminase-like enzymes, putative cysteine proteases n=1 Tax=uncultured Thiotrichaceae bacterium TaxID=298394 RepID=A0A6S6SR02_9GAMM|nr:MAG: FIG001454: Transglutaminase-like enzymes, putative cysteine proteases [uncultured Thiotrichaceae bacterium]